MYFVEHDFIVLRYFAQTPPRQAQWGLCHFLPARRDYSWSDASTTRKRVVFTDNHSLARRANLTHPTTSDQLDGRYCQSLACASC